MKPTRGRPRKDKIPTPEKKKCGQCKRIKSSILFSVNNASRDGLQAICKKCDNDNKRDWYQKNHEREIKKRKEWIENNREKHNEIAYAYLVRKGKIKKPRRMVVVQPKSRIVNGQGGENEEPDK